MVKLWWKAKGAERAILVTDAMSATGMPDGTYQLGGFAVEVGGGRAMARGVLAGSVLTLDRALENFMEFTGAPLEQALRLLTVNPVRMTGLDELAGSLAAGKPASFAAVDRMGRLVGSMVNGEAAFSPQSAVKIDEIRGFFDKKWGKMRCLPLLNRSCV